MKPTTNGENNTDGRGADGRFVRGNHGGPGCPYISRIAQWRAVMAKTITPDDIAAVVRTLVVAGRAGRPWAVKVILDHCVGSLVEVEIRERIAELEAMLEIES